LKVIAVSGSYRPDGPTEQAAKAILEGAASKGAATVFVALRDKDIRFCLNCRSCGQEPGEEPGDCVIKDDMAGLIKECLSSDVLVFSSPINFYQATALSKLFVERLVPMGYWPWKKGAPANRIKRKSRKAVLISSSAAPGIMARIAWPKALAALRAGAEVLGARVVKHLHYGLASVEKRVVLSEKDLKRAFELGAKLIA
jgi:multimeric flavodoxin WrbA